MSNIFKKRKEFYQELNNRVDKLANLSKENLSKFDFIDKEKLENDDIIFVYIDDIEQMYTDYSVIKYRLNDDIFEYIESNLASRVNKKNKKNEQIDIYFGFSNELNEHLKDNTYYEDDISNSIDKKQVLFEKYYYDKSKIKESYKNHYALKIKETLKRMSTVRITSLILLCIGLIVFTLYSLLEIYLKDFAINQAIMICGWVFIDASISNFVFTNFSNRRDLKKYKCLYNAKIEILN